MRICVAVKQVPDTSLPLTVVDGSLAVPDHESEWVASPLDEYALELALRLKDAEPSTEVTAVSVGSRRLVGMLRKALALGCDDVVLLRHDDGDRPRSAAEPLMAYLARERFDVVMCGDCSADSQQRIVGHLAAATLGVPVMTAVTDVAVERGELLVARETEAVRQSWRLRPPAVLTVLRSPTDLRYPPLRAIMRARKAEIREEDVVFPSLVGEDLQVLRFEGNAGRGPCDVRELGSDPEPLAKEVARRIQGALA